MVLSHLRQCRGIASVNGAEKIFRLTAQPTTLLASMVAAVLIK
jgi:hypothetical protein